MASISKRVSGAWQNTSYGIRATATDTITTLPTTIYGDGTNATVGVYGNTIQNGTPTSGSPIIPQGTGDLETEGAKAGQYKIPVSSANTTTPVYLGEVQTTRRIKKMVFDGMEAWRLYALSGATNVERFYLVVSKNAVSAGSIISSHFPTLKDNSDTEHTRFGGSKNNELYIYISRTVATTVADLKSYLAAQYAAGTPVTVWYVLANEETAVVNEPLMRIDEYADEVSGVSIPTTDGANTLSVDTTAQPSEVNVNYHGWHMDTVHERVSCEWD